MTETKEPIILNAINRLSEQFINKLGTLSSSEWEAPSHCHMWATKDVVSHMIATTGFFLNSVTRALQGEELPPEGAPNPGVGSAATMGAGIASRAIQISETDFHNYNSMLETLRSMESDMAETFHSITAEQWNLGVYHPINKISIRDILYLKLMESVLHSWDVLHALDKNYRIESESASILTEVWTNPLLNRWFISPEEKFNTVTLDFHLSANSKMRIISWNGNLEIMKPAFETDGQADAEIYTDSSLFSLLITARLNLDEAIQTGIASVTGNRKAADKFHAWFKGA